MFLKLHALIFGKIQLYLVNSAISPVLCLANCFPCFLTMICLWSANSEVLCDVSIEYLELDDFINHF